MWSGIDFARMISSEEIHMYEFCAHLDRHPKCLALTRHLLDSKPLQVDVQSDIKHSRVILHPHLLDRKRAKRREDDLLCVLGEIVYRS